MKIFDISLTIKDGMVVYPGNPLTSVKQIKKMPEASSNLSLITMGSHNGTHVDASKHVDNNGKGIDVINIDSLIGKAEVLDLTHVDFEIKKSDFNKVKINKGDIILLKTRNSLESSKVFNERFVHLSLEAADHLVSKGIKAIGIDYLSVQKFHSGNQDVHSAFLKNNILIIEGLSLKNIKSGNYEFVCLPLKIKDCDGAPARAILIKK